MAVINKTLCVWVDNSLNVDSGSLSDLSGSDSINHVFIVSSKSEIEGRPGLMNSFNLEPG